MVPSGSFVILTLGLGASRRGRDGLHRLVIVLLAALLYLRGIGG